MRREKMTRACLAAAAALAIVAPSSGSAQPECEDIRKSCLDHCHYAPQNQWSSGFKCKRECNKQVDACRRGMRGYAPRYGYGAEPGYGPQAAPGGGAPYGYGAAAHAPYGRAVEQPGASAGPYGQPGYPAYGTQAPYGAGGYPVAPQRGYATPRYEEPYTGP